MEVTAIIVILLVSVTTGGYFYLLIFHPEWVGITGKSAKQTLDEHQEGSKSDDSDFFSNKKS